MASMQRQPSQRRQSPLPTPTPEASSSVTHTDVQTTANQGKDDSKHDSASEAIAQEQDIGGDEALDRQGEDTVEHAPIHQQKVGQSAAPRLLSADDDPSVKKCWICFSDSTEDTPETSPWRDPCPCALVAHEECLLDWIADTEAPKNTTRGDILSPKILCPQCKSEIKLARPRSYVVDLVRLLNRSTARYVMPAGTIALSVEMLYKLTITHGIHTIYRVFGREDARRILQPILRGPHLNSKMTFREIVLAMMAHHIQHIRLYLGLPLITPMLLLSRARWHISEAFLTVLPTLLFVIQPPAPGESFTFTPWPPSASMAFAVLPYVRQVYNYYYERVWGDAVRRWKKEVLPVTSQNQADAQPAHDAVQAIEDAADGDGNVFEIRVDGGIWEQWDGNEQAAPAPNIPDNRGQADQAEPPRAAQAPAPAQGQQMGERRLSFSPLALAENIIGALVFPTVAELSGELIKLVLPNTWTTLPNASTIGSNSGLRISLWGRLVTSNGSDPRPTATGIFQQKWARSLIGGCIFVVFKDALMLYVRWKTAQMHKNRRVLDFDRSKTKSKAR